MTANKFNPNNLRLTREARNTILFLVGLVGIIAELITSQVERPYLLAILGGMVGLPQFLKIDEAAKEEEENAE